MSEYFTKITRNAAQCGRCSDIIESKHRHDFVRCSCGNISVDGGTAYTRRSFGDTNWTDLTEYSILSKEDLILKIEYYKELAKTTGMISVEDTIAEGELMLLKHYGVTL